MQSPINIDSIPDHYRWLEDGQNKRVQDWIMGQNKLTETSLKGDEFSGFESELIDSFKVTNFSEPIPVNGKYFYTERKPGEDQFVLYMKIGLNSKPIHGITIDQPSTQRSR